MNCTVGDAAGPKTGRFWRSTGYTKFWLKRILIYFGGWGGSNTIKESSAKTPVRPNSQSRGIEEYCLWVYDTMQLGGGYKTITNL